ncbi:trans-aconitate methyltransferase 1 [Rhodotorula toruloides]
MQGYGEFFFQKQPSLNPLITTYSSGTLGKYWQQPGRSIVEALLTPFPFPFPSSEPSFDQTSFPPLLLPPPQSPTPPSPSLPHSTLRIHPPRVIQQLTRFDLLHPLRPTRH